MNEKEIQETKEKYVSGTKIKLLETLDDSQPIESGTIGKVDHVDDMGTIHMIWDNGRTLGIIPNEDKFEIISSIEQEKEKEELEK